MIITAPCCPRTHKCKYRYSAFSRRAEYCDYRVCILCVCVCLSASLSPKLRVHRNFCAVCMSPMALARSSGFTHKMAPKTSWNRYGTKLRHCHPMYCITIVQNAISRVTTGNNLFDTEARMCGHNAVDCSEPEVEM